MSSEIKLRWYQQEAVDSVFGFWKQRPGQHPLIVAPCGAGKSIIIAELVRRVMEYPNTRVLMLTHKMELILQNEAELQLLWPFAPTGFFSAGVGQKNWSAPILYAGIQSIYGHLSEMDPFDVVIIDEAHLIPRSEGSQYQKAIAAIKAINPNATVVGLTATHYRQDSGLLTDGPDNTFDGVCYNIPIQTLLDEGHLVEVIAQQGEAKPDLSGLRWRAGDFVLKDMAEAFSADGVTAVAVDEIIRRGADRRAWVVFCSGVDHAHETAQLFRDRGVDVAVITGSTPDDERRNTLKRFRDGGLKCLVNVNVLTTGFNAPVCDLLAILRCMGSTSLYVQTVGRVMRPALGKKNGLLLDYGENVLRHGPIDAVTVARKPGKATEEDRAKACPQCSALLALNVRQCNACGYVFESAAPVHEVKAFDGAVLTSQIKPEWLNVVSVEYSNWNRGKAPSVRVDFYTDDGRAISEWWLPEHAGFAREKTARMLKNRYGIVMPETRNELLRIAQSFQIPEQILVAQNGKYFEIKEARGFKDAPERTTKGRLGDMLRGLP